MDERHAHKTRTVYDVVDTGIGQRDHSLPWVITTSGSNRAGGCVAELSAHCEKICLNPAGYRLRPELSDD